MPQKVPTGLVGHPKGLGEVEASLGAVVDAVEGIAAIGAVAVVGWGIAVNAAVVEDCMKVEIELAEGCIEDWDSAAGTAAGTAFVVVR